MRRPGWIFGWMLAALWLFLPAGHAAGVAATAGDHGPAAQADFSASAPLSELVRHALENNPEIHAAREGWRANVEQIRITTGYPDPQLMVTYYPNPIETRLGPQEWNATLSQMIPFPGKLTAAGRVAMADARMARVKLDQTIRRVTADLRASCYELWYIQQARRVADQNAALLDDLRRTGEAAYAQDRAAFVDVVQAQSQVGQVRYDQILLSELEQTETARLNALLNRPPDAPVGTLILPPDAPVVYSLPELYKLAETHQETIRMADLQVEKAEARTALAGFDSLPDFRIGVFYGAIGEPDVAMPPPDAGDDAYGIQMGVTLPLWFGKNAGKKEKARAEAQQARAEKINQVNQLQSSVRTLHFKLGNARRLVRLYADDLLPQAMRAIDTAGTWFREGQGSYSDFVETQAAAYNFQLSLARARADYGKYLAELERLVGVAVTHGADAEGETK